MKHINTLIEDLTKIYGENIISIVHYGKNSNLLVIFDKLEAADIKKASPAIKKWVKTKNPLPIIMSENEWMSSADIYPVEYAEIKHSYKILYGKDIVEQINVLKSDLRLKCEYEIKNLLVRIREIYLGNSDNPKHMAKILEEVSFEIIRVLKSSLILFDMPAVGDYNEIINNISEKIDFDSEIFIKILSLKEKNKKIAGNEIEETIQRTINSIDSVYNFINHWKE